MKSTREMAGWEGRAQKIATSDSEDKKGEKKEIASGEGEESLTPQNVNDSFLTLPDRRKQNEDETSGQFDFVNLLPPHTPSTRRTPTKSTGQQFPVTTTSAPGEYDVSKDISLKEGDKLLEQNSLTEEENQKREENREKERAKREDWRRKSELKKQLTGKKTKSARKSFMMMNQSSSSRNSRLSPRCLFDLSPSPSSPSSPFFLSVESSSSSSSSSLKATHSPKEDETKTPSSIQQQEREREREVKEDGMQCHKQRDESILSGNFVNGHLVGYGGRKWSDGSLYLGHFLDSLANGSGVLKGADGTWYEGIWKDDLPDGYGVFSDGIVIYEGMWLGGDFHGFGIHQDDHGRYLGQFREGQRHGKGRAVFGDETSYEGSFENDDFHGFGVFTSSKGMCYSGFFDHNERHGLGVQEYSEGRFEGEFQLGIIFGHGVFHYADGSCYKGQWAHDAYHGQGSRTWEGGMNYSGDFQNDMFCGYGVFEIEGVSSYEGGFKQDQMDGYGELTLVDGTYSGQFKKGEFDGVGHRAWKDGRNYYGNWRRGKMEGEGAYYMGDAGRREDRGYYFGSFVNGLPDGCGCWVYPDGSHYLGEFKQKKRHGMGRFVLSDGGSYDGEWRDDKFHGLGCRCWPDGTNLEGEFRVGFVHGLGVFTNLFRGYTYRGRFQGGSKDGLGAYCWQDGSKYLGESRDDVRTGYGVLCSADSRKAGRWVGNSFSEPKIALFSSDRDLGTKKAKEAWVSAREAHVIASYARAKWTIFTNGLLKDFGRFGDDIGRLLGRELKRMRATPAFLTVTQEQPHWDNIKETYPAQRHQIDELISIARECEAQTDFSNGFRDPLGIQTADGGIEGQTTVQSKIPINKSLDEECPKEKKRELRDRSKSFEGSFLRKEGRGKEEETEKEGSKKDGKLNVWYFVGPTGSGKTKCADLIGRCLTEKSGFNFSTEEDDDGKGPVIHIKITPEMKVSELLSILIQRLEDWPSGVVIFRNIDKGSSELLLKLSQIIQNKDKNDRETSSSQKELEKYPKKAENEGRQDGDSTWSHDEFKRYENLFFSEMARKKSKGKYDPTHHLLHCAAAGDFIMFQFLVEHTGADPEIPLSAPMGMFEKGAKPLEIARKYESVQIIQYIEKWVEKKNTRKSTYSHFPERCYTLLRNEVAAMGPSYSPDEHLLKSSMMGDLAMVRFLIEEIGANPAFEKPISEEGRVSVLTPFLAAANSNRRPIATYIKQVIVEGKKSEIGDEKGKGKGKGGKAVANRRSVTIDSLFDFTSTDPSSPAMPRASSHHSVNQPTRSSFSDLIGWKEKEKKKKDDPLSPKVDRISPTTTAQNRLLEESERKEKVRRRRLSETKVQRIEPRPLHPSRNLSSYASSTSSISPTSSPSFSNSPNLFSSTLGSPSPPVSPPVSPPLSSTTPDDTKSFLSPIDPAGSTKTTNPSSSSSSSSPSLTPPKETKEDGMRNSLDIGDFVNLMDEEKEEKREGKKEGKRRKKGSGVVKNKQRPRKKKLSEVVKGATFIFVTCAASQITVTEWIRIMEPTKAQTDEKVNSQLKDLYCQIRRLVEAVCRADEELDVRPEIGLLMYSSAATRSSLVSQRHFFCFLPFSFEEMLALLSAHLVQAQKRLFEYSKSLGGHCFLLIEPGLSFELTDFYMRKMFQGYCYRSGNSHRPSHITQSSSSNSDPFSSLATLEQLERKLASASTPDRNSSSPGNTPNRSASSPSFSPHSSSQPSSPSLRSSTNSSPSSSPSQHRSTSSPATPRLEFNQLQCFRHFDYALKTLSRKESVKKFLGGVGMALVLGFTDIESSLYLSCHDSR